MIELKFEPFDEAKHMIEDPIVRARHGRKKYRVGTILKMNNGALRLVGHINESYGLGGDTKCTPVSEVKEVAFIGDELGVPDHPNAWRWSR